MAGKHNAVPKLRFPGFTDAWEQRKLGELGEFNPKSSLPEEFEYVDLESVVGTTLVSHRTELKESAPSRAQRLAQYGDVFYQTVRPYQRNNYLYVLPYENYVFSTGYAQIRPYVDSYFLLSCLQKEQFVNRVLDNCTGTSYPAINSTDLAEIKVGISINKQEQTTIGNFFSTIDHKISLLQNKHKLLSQYKQGVMQKLFSGSLRFKDEKGQDFPDWEQHIIKNIACIVGGGTPLTTNGSFWNGDIEWFTPSEIDSKYLPTSKKKITHLGLKESSAKLLPVGTVLFTSRATIGDVAITDRAVTTNQGFQAFIPHQNVSNQFLYYWLQYNKKIFLEKSSGSTFLEISKKAIESIPILLPATIEQTQIAHFLSTLDAKLDKLANQIDMAKRWKQGLLQQMFV